MLKLITLKRPIKLILIQSYKNEKTKQIRNKLNKSSTKEGLVTELMLHSVVWKDIKRKERIMDKYYFENVQKREQPEGEKKMRYRNLLLNLKRHRNININKNIMLLSHLKHFIHHQHHSTQ